MWCVPLFLASTWFVLLSVCDHSQGFYFPPNHRRWYIVFWGLFQQTNKTKIEEEEGTGIASDVEVRIRPPLVII